MSLTDASTAQIVGDPVMPFLRQALDPKVAGREIRDHITGANRAELLGVRVTRYKAGRRCLIEYDIAMEGADGWKGVTTVIGKARARATDTASYWLARQLWDGGFSDESADGISVPEPLGVIPAFQMWVQRKVPGVVATRLLPSDEGQVLAKRIAEAAHKLHNSWVQGDRVHTMMTELSILHDRLGAVTRIEPKWQPRLERILERCERIGAAVPVPVARGIHRDFYPDQVLVNGDRLYLLDFDLYSTGDPGLDIGNFLAHMTEQSLRTLGDPCAMAAQETALRERYLQLAGSSVILAIRAYATLSLVRHIYLSTQFPERQGLTSTLLELCERRLGDRLSRPRM